MSVGFMNMSGLPDNNQPKKQAPDWINRYGNALGKVGRFYRAGLTAPANASLDYMGALGNKVNGALGGNKNYFDTDRFNRSIDEFVPESFTQSTPKTAAPIAPTTGTPTPKPAPDAESNFAGDAYMPGAMAQPVGNKTTDIPKAPKFDPAAMELVQGSIGDTRRDINQGFGEQADLHRQYMEAAARQAASGGTPFSIPAMIGAMNTGMENYSTALGNKASALGHLGAQSLQPLLSAQEQGNRLKDAYAKEEYQNRLKALDPMFATNKALHEAQTKHFGTQADLEQMKADALRSASSEDRATMMGLNTKKDTIEARNMQHALDYVGRMYKENPNASIEERQAALSEIYDAMQKASHGQKYVKQGEDQPEEKNIFGRVKTPARKAPYAWQGSGAPLAQGPDGRMYKVDPKTNSWIPA